MSEHIHQSDLAGNSSPEVRSHLRFVLASGVGPVTFRKLIDAFGDIESVENAPRRQWQQVDGVSPKRANAIAEVTESQIDDEIASASDAGVKILCPPNPDYPAGLKNIYDPPMVLYVRGEITGADATAIGIVGARRCTHYGLEQAGRFAQLLGQAGFTVISGGARGIDTAAHRGALAAEGRTIAVMGCGLGCAYPPENAELFDHICAGPGAAVSELPMATGVKIGNFPIRNRIISGLSLGVLVIEAAKRSGALITARVAAEQGRSVFALPGRVDSPTSCGTNSLIRDGVTLVQDLDDILDDLGEVGNAMMPEAEEIDQPAIMPMLDDTEKQLITCLSQGPRTIDELIGDSNLQSSRVSSAMTMLLLKGAVTQLPGNVFVAKPWARKISN